MIPQPPTSHPDLRRNESLRASIREGAGNAVMLGAGETYLGPYGIFIGGSALQIGTLASLPALLGAVSQALGVSLLENFRNRRSIIVCSALVHAFMWIPIMLLPLALGSGTSTVSVLIALVAVYFIFANLGVPSWSSLIGDLVPADSRGRFFGFRSKISGISTFSATLLAGLILQTSTYLPNPIIPFAVIFSFAFMARLYSIFWLRRYANPPYSGKASDRFSFFQFLRRSPHSNFAKFVYFVSFMNFSIHFAAPYYAVYMFRELHMSFMQFTIISAASVVSQSLTLQHWGKLTDQFGNKVILNFCSIGIAIAPLFWLLSSDIFYLVMIQFYGGFVWAGFNLSSSNFMFDAVTPPKRARCAAFQAIITGIFIFLGALVGGQVLTNFGDALATNHWFRASTSPILFVFLFSAILRSCVSILFLRLFREVREVEAIKHRDLIFRVIHVRPIAGATFAFITSPLKRKKASKSKKLT